MKVNAVMALLSLAAGALIGYGFSVLGGSTLLSVFAGVEAGVLLAIGSSVSVEEYPRVSVMLKTTALTFFAVLLVVNVLIGAFAVGVNGLVIINGLILLLAAATLYKVGSSRV